MKFKVVYEPEEGAWNVSVPSVRGCHTWGRSLAAARRHIREALATCVDVLGEDAERIAREAELVESFRLPVGAKAALARYRKAKRVTDRMARSCETAKRAAASALTHGSRISLRDAGELLGLSHERVNQLLHAK